MCFTRLAVVPVCNINIGKGCTLFAVAVHLCVPSFMRVCTISLAELNTTL